MYLSQERYYPCSSREMMPVMIRLKEARRAIIPLFDFFWPFWGGMTMTTIINNN